MSSWMFGFENQPLHANINMMGLGKIRLLFTEPGFTILWRQWNEPSEFSFMMGTYKFPNGSTRVDGQS